MKKLSQIKSYLKKLSMAKSVYLALFKLFNRNKITGRGKIIKQNALLLNSNIVFRGNGNVILLAPTSRIENYSIKIYGNNNKISIGKNCLMKDGEFWIEDDNNEINVGAYTTIQGNTQLAAIEGCKIDIGEDCMFSSDIVVRTGDSHSIVNSENKRINKSEDVHIGNHCWVGHRAMIFKGTKINNNSIIGASAIVNKVFDQENTIIAGIPARVIKENVNWLRKRI